MMGEREKAPTICARCRHYKDMEELSRKSGGPIVHHGFRHACVTKARGERDMVTGGYFYDWEKALDCYDKNDGDCPDFKIHPKFFRGGLSHLQTR